MLCDEQLEKGGAQRLIPWGIGDASGAELFEVFDDFERDLWQRLEQVRSLKTHIQQ